jgi:RHS repeat-associated protein
VAQHISIGSTVETQYFHRDHLGSVEATSDDVSTPNMDYIGYDAWGSRIVSPDAENIRLGFTGHETISEQAPDLVHMNGRVYDPAIGRFLTADPLIPDPFSSQSFNRYSYVSNNPLSYSDPSGYREENGQRDEQEKVNGWVDEFGNEYKMVRFGNPPCPFPPDCRQNGIPIPPMPLPYPEPELPDIGFRFIPALPDIGIQMTGLHGYQNISYSQYMFDAQSTSHIGQYPAAQTFGLTTPAWTSSINPDPGTVVINQRGATSSMMGDSSGFTPGTPGDLGAPFPLAEVLIGGAVFKGAGPFQQWFRLKGSYSHTLGAKTALSLSWGASKAKNGKYVDEITSPMWRRINQWLRELRIPGSSWRTQDPGHFHIKPPPSD